MSHTGIRLRITFAGRAVLEGDSDWLHLKAKMGGGRAQVPNTIDEIIAGQPAEDPWHLVMHTDQGMQIWIQPCMLTDLQADDDPGTPGQDAGNVQEAEQLLARAARLHDSFNIWIGAYIDEGAGPYWHQDDLEEAFRAGWTVASDSV